MKIKISKSKQSLLAITQLLEEALNNFKIVKYTKVEDGYCGEKYVRNLEAHARRLNLSS